MTSPYLGNIIHHIRVSFAYEQNINVVVDVICGDVEFLVYSMRDWAPINFIADSKKYYLMFF